MFPKVNRTALQPTQIAWGECCTGNLTCSFCPELKHQHISTSKVNTLLWSSSLVAKENLETFVLQWHKPWWCMMAAYKRSRKWSYFGLWDKQRVLFAWGGLSPTCSNSRAKLFSELDKISDKPGLHFLSRPNKCFLFLIFVMASGPVDCYWSALHGRPLISAVCSVLPTSTVQRSWDLLKTTIFSLFICCWGFESLQFIF